MLADPESKFSQDIVGLLVGCICWQTRCKGNNRIGLIAAEAIQSSSAADVRNKAMFTFVKNVH